MLEHLLRIGNIHWSGDAYRPALTGGRSAAGADADALRCAQGRFAAAFHGDEPGVVLLRDPLGLNKLFACLHESGMVVAANYLIDLVDYGAPFESIYSVPAGHIVRLDPRSRKITLERYAAVPPPAEGLAADRARTIRARLETWFGRLAAQFGDRRIRVCLSGGLDSGIMAALATRYFSHVTAYTYSFAERGARPSDDAAAAERLAEALSIPLRIVSASAADVLDAVDGAVCYGQDWRDFNVHCAIVNEILARAIRYDTDNEPSGIPSLVLTGDLANELLADYSPVSCGGRMYYELPRIDRGSLRTALVRGLDAGDREVGVFAHHGLEVVQPYALVADEYLRLPGSILERPGFKQQLSRAIAGDLLPEFVFDRVKVRAQVGSSDEPTGILPVLAGCGYDSSGLRRVFCRIFGVRDEGVLTAFIRAGRYRILDAVAHGRTVIDGYVAA